jgi:hypothetical protein
LRLLAADARFFSTTWRLRTRTNDTDEVVDFNGPSSRGPDEFDVSEGVEIDYIETIVKARWDSFLITQSEEHRG